MLHGDEMYPLRPRQAKLLFKTQCECKICVYDHDLVFPHLLSYIALTLDANTQLTSTQPGSVPRRFNQLQLVPGFPAIRAPGPLLRTQSI